MRVDVLLVPLPAEVAELAEDEEHPRRPGQEGHEAERAPQHAIGRRQVAGKRLVGEIVRVGVVAAGPVGHRRPGGPGEEGRELAQFLGVLDELRRQAAVPFGRDEILFPAADLALERRRLDRHEYERTRGGVISVRFQHCSHRAGERAALGVGELVERSMVSFLGEGRLRIRDEPVQVVGREVGAQVRAVAPDRPVLHQAVLQKDLLPGPDIVAGEDDFSRRADKLLGNRRADAVGVERDPDEDGEPRHQGNEDAPPPPWGKRFRRTGLGLAHGAPHSVGRGAPRLPHKSNSHGAAARRGLHGS